MEWIHSSGEPIHTLAVSDKDSSKIYVYDGREDGKPIKIIEKIHMNPVTLIRYNHKFEIAVSVDKKGMLGMFTTLLFFSFVIINGFYLYITKKILLYVLSSGYSYS